MEIDARQLRVLTREGMSEASRRRIVPIVIVISLLSLMMMNSCTSCDGQIKVNADVGAPVDLLGWAGAGIFLVLGLWSVLLAGLLAADHLSAMLEDDSALLVLSRPVSRETLVLSRLLGSLGVSLGAALVLLGGTTFMLVTRSDLPLGPALHAIATVGVSAITLAALGMACSLYLVRIATFVVLIACVASISTLNLLALSGVELSGVYAAINGVGPPFALAIIGALLPWSGQALPEGAALGLAIRQAAWLVVSVVALVYAFTQRELKPPPS